MKFRLLPKARCLLAVCFLVPIVLHAQQNIREVMVLDNKFDPDSVVIEVGTTVRWIDFADDSNLHNVVSEDGLWTAPALDDGWTFIHKFTEPGTFQYYCEAHRDQGMVATIVVTGQPDTGGLEFNAGQNGNWWNGVARDGEGVQIELADAGGGDLVFVATIYSYGPQGGQIFLIAVGTPNGDMVDVDVFITDGGFWGGDFDPNDVAQTQWGSGVFASTDCGQISMMLTPNSTYEALGYTTLEYDLERLTTSAIQCPYDG